MRFGSLGQDREIVDESTKERRGQAVLIDRVNLLYSGLPLSLLVAFAVAVLYVYALRNLGMVGGTYIWLGAVTAILATRVLIGWAHRHYPARLPDETAWLRAYRAGACLTAVAWGAAGILFLPADNMLLQAMTILVLAGVSSGAQSALAADFPTYRNFVLLTLLPLIALTLLRGEELQTLIGMLGIAFLTFMLKSGHQNSQSIVDALTLHHENAGLIGDLEREKNRVLNEAETMITTVLSTAPIALWAVDNDGAISFIEGSLLGTRTSQQLPTVGTNLFGIYERQPQIAYATRRAIEGHEFSTEIELDSFTFEVHYKPWLGDDGRQHGAIGVAIDITDRIEHKKELSRRAHYDELTGLPNRTLIMSQIGHAFENARRHGRHVALFFVDLDNFKTVNDTMGHDAGDQLLREAAERLRSTVRRNDLPARLGGDEFVIVSEDLTKPEDAEIIAHKITRLFQRPFEVDQREVFTTTSIGVAVYPQDGDTAERLLKSADTAMYHAKSAGKNKYRFFTHEMQDVAERHLAMETELRRALARDELHLMYQPKYESQTGRIRGAEALLRWDSPKLGHVTPDDFIPVAEFAGLMPQIGDWVLQAACREAAQWQELVDTTPHVAINVSPQQFRNTDLLANVTQALVGTGLTPAMLELEITESVLVQDAPETMQIFDDINDLGVSLSLDDFGTGYSSLSYLKKFPMQVLKIDKAFVQDLGNDRDDDSLVEAIIAMAHSLHMEIVAEGVETAQQFDFLKRRGVELVQGYYFSKPVTADEFRTMLCSERARQEDSAAAI